MTTPLPHSTEPAKMTGAVVSDLHLFSPRSDGHRLFSEFETTAAPLHALVLNGDTFDFRWSRLPSEAATIDAAAAWLESLLSRHPGRQVHYLLGNHDCLTSFRHPLEILSNSHTNFHLHDYHLLLGDHLFLHGDCTNRKMDGDALWRFRRSWSRDRPRSRASAALYAASDSIGLSRHFHTCYFPHDRTVTRVAYHLDHVLPGWTGMVRRCYFGHSHRPIHGLQKFGVRFFNTGSGIRGMGFSPRTFRWTTADNPTRVAPASLT